MPNVVPNPSTQPRRAMRTGRSGFTLTEVLVASTLSVVVLGTLFVLFTAASRTSQQGYQRIEGYEMARQVFALMERDLQAAFTASEYGDVYKFVGTPLGFMFVGLTGANISQSSADPSFARVSYVIYAGDPEDPNNNPANPAHEAPLFGSNVFPLVERDIPRREGETIPLEQAEAGDSIITYSMLRFVEPNVSDLDAYPAVNGQEFWRWYANAAGNLESNPEFTTNVERPGDVIGWTSIRTDWT